jgi:MoaA/NifB/PqqE/SkfB family radical SAM enzyme
MLSTNGSLLTNTVSTSLVESGLDEIIISMDACTSEDIYQRIRTGGTISKLVDNVTFLLAHHRNLHVILQFIDLFINESEKDAFIERWAQYDCTISIQCLYTWAGQIPSLSLASNTLSPVLKKPRVPCADLWNKLSIHWNGLVSACCFDWNNLLVIGDCQKSKLYDIWNDLPIQRLRLLHSELDISSLPLCRSCDAWAEPEEYINLFNLQGESGNE